MQSKVKSIPFPCSQICFLNRKLLLVLHEIPAAALSPFLGSYCIVYQRFSRQNTPWHQGGHPKGHMTPRWLVLSKEIGRGLLLC